MTIAHTAKQTWRNFLRAEQRQRQAHSLWRHRPTLGSVQQPFVEAEGQWRTNFSSNDYLGLASLPQLADSVATIASQWGVGSGASHLVCGHQGIHHQFEEELADFVGAEKALLFSTGYMANLAIGAAFLKRGDLSVHDRLNHASLLDGARLSDGKLLRYQHLDTHHAEQRIQSSAYRRLQIVTDGVFSMDGDVAPIKDLTLLSERYDALLCVDDAHGFGVLGESGRGVLSQFGLRPTENLIMIGTLGKALGSFGAFVAGDALFIDQLVQSARSYIYTTALPPTVVAAGLAALAVLREQHQKLFVTLSARIAQFRAACANVGVELMPSDTPIQPILLGDEALAVAISQSLYDQGFMVPAIRTPTVAKGKARLRITLSAAHTELQVDALVQALAVSLERLRSSNPAQSQCA